MKIIQIIPIKEKHYHALSSSKYVENQIFYGLGDDGILYKMVGSSSKQLWQKVISSEDVKVKKPKKNKLESE